MSKFSKDNINLISQKNNKIEQQHIVMKINTSTKKHIFPPKNQ